MKNHTNTEQADYEALRLGYVAYRRVRLVTGALAESPITVRRAVELGAGTGWLAAQLATALPTVLFHATDALPAMVAYAASRYALPNLEFALCDAACEDEFPLSDFMYSVDTLHHVQGQAPLIRRARAALPTGGRWLVIEPNVFQPGMLLAQERMKRAGLDENHFRPWRTEPLWRQAGFAVVRRQYRFLFPAHWRTLSPPLSWLERRCEGWPVAGANVVYLLEAV